MRSKSGRSKKRQYRKKSKQYKQKRSFRRNNKKVAKRILSKRHKLRKKQKGGMDLESKCNLLGRTYCIISKGCKYVFNDGCLVDTDNCSIYTSRNQCVSGKHDCKWQKKFPDDEATGICYKNKIIAIKGYNDKNKLVDIYGRQKNSGDESNKLIIQLEFELVLNSKFDVRFKFTNPDNNLVSFPSYKVIGEGNSNLYSITLTDFGKYEILKNGNGNDNYIIDENINPFEIKRD